MARVEDRTLRAPRTPWAGGKDRSTCPIRRLIQEQSSDNLLVVGMGGGEGGGDGAESDGMSMRLIAVGTCDEVVEEWKGRVARLWARQSLLR